MYKDLLAGGVAGTFGVLVGHPMDTIKARLQTSSDQSLRAMNVLQEAVQREGFRSLYRGMAAPLFSAGLLNALLFAGYTATLRQIHSDTKATITAEGQQQGPPIIKIMIASTMGTLFQLIPAIPIELVKTQLQTRQDGKHCHQNSLSPTFKQGPLNCAIRIVQQSGLIGLYRGGTIMFWRDLIGYFFYIPAYEIILDWLKKRLLAEKQCDRNFLTKGEHKEPMNYFNGHEDICQLLAGGMAGSLSWWIICPLELLKNQLQAQKVVHPDPPPPKCHQSAQNAVPSMSSCSIRSICVEIFRKAQQQHWRGQEGTWAQPASPPLLHSNCDTARRLRNWLLGLSAFYRGGLLIACRAFPVNACVFYVHAKCRELF